MKQIGYKINIIGIVQGVGYRYHCQEVATRLGLSGSVMNMPDGSVDIEVFGNKLLIDEFINNIKQSGELYTINTVIKHEIAVKPNNGEFVILHYPGY